MGWGGTLLPRIKFLVFCTLESERLDVFMKEREAWQISQQIFLQNFISHRVDGYEDENLFLSWRTIIDYGRKIVKEFLRKRSYSLALWSKISGKHRDIVTHFKEKSPNKITDTA